MGQTPGDSGANPVFAFDPTGKVVGIISDADAAEAALGDLRAAGFGAGDLHLLVAEETAGRIGAGRDEQEVTVHVFRPEQRVPAYYDAPVIARRVEQALRDGHQLIGVAAKDTEARALARDILKSRGGHFINFYGILAAEAL